ncbi:MAG TPA: toxin TcdB middle/N-terminal domain-containing protein [Bacillota bacterium]|nr:toxin TcdB middle/N-terminal domain-containing protein [Bacillota bacterium]
MIIEKTLKASETGTIELNQDMTVAKKDKIHIVVNGSKDQNGCYVDGLGGSFQVSYTKIDDTASSVTVPYSLNLIQEEPISGPEEEPGKSFFWVAPKDGSIQVQGILTASRSFGQSDARSVNATKPVMNAKRSDDVILAQTQIAFQIPDDEEAPVGPAKGQLTLNVVKGDIIYFEFNVNKTNFYEKLPAATVNVNYADESETATVAGQIISPVKAKDSGTRVVNQSYRGWGCFGYNGDGERATQPIDENDLTVQANYGSPQTKAYLMQSHSNSGSWQGSVNNIVVTGSTMSSSRMGASDVAVTLNDGATGQRGISRISKAKQTGCSAGVGLDGISVTGAFSNGHSESMLDFMDLNGDRFPDIVTPGYTQFTTMDGGLAADGYPNNASDDPGEVRNSVNQSQKVGIGGSVPLMQPSSRGYVQGSSKAQDRWQMTSLGINVNIGEDRSSSNVNWELLDINGDGLPDRVNQSGGRILVQLNLGYKFANQVEDWGAGTIDDTRGENDKDTPELYGSYNREKFAFAGGISYTRSRSTGCKSLLDINGDGLPDFVEKVTGDNQVTYQVCLNTGSGFGPPQKWLGPEVYETNPESYLSLSSNATLGGGVYLTTSIKLGWWGYLILNPGADSSAFLNNRQFALMDLDGDGLVDWVDGRGASGTLKVGLNQTGLTNKLTEIVRPLGGTITLGYDRKGNTYALPQSKWVLSKVTVNDGHSGDGVNTQTTIINYDNGRYDRLEREFCGFGEVTVAQVDTNRNPVRKITRNYHNDSTYTKGLLAGEKVTDGLGRLYSQSKNSYELATVSEDTVTRVPVIFPQLIRNDQSNFEGSGSGISSYTQYSYDAYGNNKSYIESGHPGRNGNVKVDLTYYEDTAKYIVGQVKSTKVYGSNNLMRHREADYNAYGEMTQIRRYLADGRVEQTNYDYDQYGNTRSVTGPVNHNSQRYQVTMQYDSETNTHVTKITDSFGYSSIAAYNYRYGVETTATDLNGNQSSKVYDNFGRLTKIFAPYDENMPAVEFQYYHEETVPRAVTKNKVHFDPTKTETIDTVICIDGLGRVIQTKKSGEVRAEYGMNVSGKAVFDALGRIVEQGQPVFQSGYDTGYYEAVLKNPTKTLYDCLDRVVQVTLPDNSVVSTKFTVEDGLFKETHTDPLNKTSYTYKDLNGNTVKTVQFNKGETITTSYEYDPLDQLVKVIDNKNNVTQTGYDWLGQRTSINNPDRGLVEYQYDLAGNLVKKIDANLRKANQGINYIYDYNRLKKVDYPTTTDVEYEYGQAGAAKNQAGRIVKVSDASGYTQFEYGKIGETVKEYRKIHAIQNGMGDWDFTSETRYDYLGRTEWMKFPDTEELNYVYDRGGQVTAAYGTKCGDRYDYIKQINYDEFGQRVYIKYGNNTESTYNYNPARRWLDSFKTTGTNGVFQDTSYSFDKEGNVLSLESKAFNVKHTYRYDDLYQLVQADGQSAIRFDFNNPNNLGNSVTSTYSQSFSYDSIGNMTSKSSKTGNDISNDVVRELLNYKFTYVYEGTKPHAPSRIGNWNYQYDDNGNTISRTRMQGSDQVRDEDIPNMAILDTYKWDEDNRLKQSYVKGTYTDYCYDYTGQRTNRKHNQGEYMYVSPYFELQYFQKWSKHIYVGDTRLVVKVSHYVPLSQISNYNREFDQRNIFVLHQDHLGSTNVISNYEGKLYEHLEYTPYGETFVDEAPNAIEKVNYKFSGKEMDPESLLYYFGARYHDALFSRWISPDPGIKEYFPDKPGDTDLPGLGGVYNPVNLNMYHYAGNNPVKYVDPDGQFLLPLLGFVFGQALPEPDRPYSEAFDSGMNMAFTFMMAGEAYHVVKFTMAYHLAGRTLSARAQQVATNNKVGNSFDTYVQGTRLKGVADRGLLATQERFYTPDVPGRKFVKPDYSIYDKNGNLAAIGDAKASPFILYDEQARGLLKAAATTKSKTLIYFTPTGKSFIAQELLNKARQEHIRIIQVEAR